MKSLLITERYLPHQGGSRRYYHELARCLDDCTVLTGHEPGDREFDDQSDVPIIRRPGVREDYSRRWYRTRFALINAATILLPKLLMMLAWTTFEVMRGRPRVIHAGGFLYAGFAARVVRMFSGIPYIVYVHGEDVAAATHGRYIVRVLRWVLHGAAGVVANAQTTAKMLGSFGIAIERVIIAHPGVDPERCRTRVRNGKERLGIKGGPILLSVGRLIAHKGFETVIRALPSLSGQWPEIRYLIVGAGSYESELRGLVKEQSVSDRVEMLGRVDDETLRDVYSAADLFVQPNGERKGVSEGYGMVYLEAGASGLAVIGGRDGGVIEAVHDGETGLLVTPWDVDALVEAVALLLNDPDLRRRMGEAGRQLAHQRTWEKTLAPAIEADRRLSCSS